LTSSSQLRRKGDTAVLGIRLVSVPICTEKLGMDLTALIWGQDGRKVDVSYSRAEKPENTFSICNDSMLMEKSTDATAQGRQRCLPRRVPAGAYFLSHRALWHGDLKLIAIISDHSVSLFLEIDGLIGVEDEAPMIRLAFLAILS
jgi:hypothetical protein